MTVSAKNIGLFVMVQLLMGFSSVSIILAVTWLLMSYMRWVMIAEMRGLWYAPISMALLFDILLLVEFMGKLAQWAKKFGLTVNAKDIVRTQDTEVAESTTEIVQT